MILVVGGAYQGKLEYLRTAYSVSEEEIFRCHEDSPQIDPDSRAVYALEKALLAMIRLGIDPLDHFRSHPELLGAHQIVVCRDLSCGVVPVDPQLRAWREATGRVCTLLAQRSEQVIRLFCGIPTRLK